MLCKWGWYDEKHHVDSHACEDGSSRFFYILHSPQGLPLMHKGHIRIHHNCSHSRSTYSYTRHNWGQIIIFFYGRSMHKSHRDMIYYLYLCTIPNNRKIRNPTTPNHVRWTPFLLQGYWSASLNMPNTKIALKRQFVHVLIIIHVKEIKSRRLTVYFDGKILVSLLLTTLQTHQGFPPNLHTLMKGTFVQRLVGFHWGSIAYSHPWF